LNEISSQYLNQKKTNRKDAIVINKFEFSANNLTANAGLFLLLAHATMNGVLVK
jgi:hypothetical protein